MNNHSSIIIAQNEYNKSFEKYVISTYIDPYKKKVKSILIQSFTTAVEII